MQEVDWAPAAPDRWPQLEGLFRACGDARGCWCGFWYRSHRQFRAGWGEGNRRFLKALIEGGAEPGVLALSGGTAVAWCGVAPRERQSRLARSRVLAAVDEAAEWSITCFVVARGHRRQGLMRPLISAAVAHASARGARTARGSLSDRSAAQAVGRGALHRETYRVPGSRLQGGRAPLSLIARSFASGWTATMAELLVNIDVADLDKAIRFYGEAFGLTVGRRFGALGVEMRGASAVIYLLVKPAGSQAYPAAAQRRDYQRHWTPVHLDIVVPEIEAALTRAERAGAAREGEVRTHRWGRIATLADPFGHGFCLIEFLGRGYDEIADPKP